MVEGLLAGHWLGRPQSIVQAGLGQDGEGEAGEVESGSTQLAGDCRKVRLSWALVSIDYVGHTLAGHTGGSWKDFPPMNCAHFYVWAWIIRKSSQGILCIGVVCHKGNIGFLIPQDVSLVSIAHAGVFLGWSLH